jgi:nucleoside-diphosphate-sugar epimerase
MAVTVLVTGGAGFIGSLACVSGEPFDAIFMSPRRGEIEHSCLEVSRARTELGWIAQTTLADGLERTVNWESARRTFEPSQTGQRKA